VITDFRPPDVVRVCPSPLYTRYEDVFRVVEIIAEVLESGAYEAIEPRGGDVT
jgi:kynureninase